MDTKTKIKEALFKHNIEFQKVFFHWNLSIAVIYSSDMQSIKFLFKLYSDGRCEIFMLDSIFHPDVDFVSSQHTFDKWESDDKKDWRYSFPFNQTVDKEIYLRFQVGDYPYFWQYCRFTKKLSL